MTADRVRACLRRTSQKLGDTHQVVGGRGEGEHPAHPGGASMTGLAQSCDGLDPAEHFLDALANAHADSVTGVPGGAAVDGGAPALAALRDMRCHGSPTTARAAS